MSNLSELLPSGGGQNEVNFVASGTLPNGQAVILNSDGTVTAVAETSVAGIVIPETASPVNFSGSGSTHITSQFSPSTANVFVVAYRDGANGYGNSIVGTVSGTSISFGTPSLFYSGLSFLISIAFDDSNPSKFVIAYSDQANSSYGTAVIGTISGTSLSYGTAVVFNSGATNQDSQVDYIASNKFAVAYGDVANSNYGTAIIGTVSGTSISFGSEYVFSAVNTTFRIYIKKDPNATDIFVVAYGENVSNVAKAVVGTVSGNSISYGSATIFESSFIATSGVSFDPNTANKFVIMFGTSSALQAIIGTRSGTSISFGSAASIQSNSVTHPAVAYDLNTANRFVVAYRNDGNSNYGTATVCTVSGSTITVGTSYVYNSYLSNYNAICFDSNNSGKFTVSFYNANGTVASTILGNLEGSIVSTNLTSTNLLGISSQAITSGATGVINTWGGLNEGQSSLTPASIYYVQSNGTISTVSTSPAQKIGQAISATTLNILDL